MMHQGDSYTVTAQKEGNKHTGGIDENMEGKTMEKTNKIVYIISPSATNSTPICLYLLISVKPKQIHFFCYNFEKKK